jgi:aryl sulfotransferase
MTTMTQLRRYRMMDSDSSLWAGFRFRPGDVVISTPPRSGTTWMQMVCALLILDTAEFDRPLNEISPWLDTLLRDTGKAPALLEAQQHRRFIKTHTPLDGLPFHTDVTYICVGRDPRDVMISLENAMANVFVHYRVPSRPTPPEDPLERFYQWADAEFKAEADEGMTLARIVNHLQTFWDRKDESQVVLFHYRDLKSDLLGQMRRLATALSIERTDERIAELAPAATFEAMRQRADELAPTVAANGSRNNRAFFHSGTNGQWRNLLDPPALAHYERRLTELASPGLAAWLRTV